MSGEGATPPIVLDEQTRLLVENLVHSTIAARATDDTVAHADAARDGTEPIAGRDAIANPLRGSGGGAGRASLATEPGDEGDGGSGEGSDRGAESGVESEGDGVRATADPAFSSGWYEAHRGEYIRSRFAIPERFDPHYPVSFEPETVRHYRTFCAGAASAGRESEANALYANAAYVTVIANELGATVRRLESLEARAPRSIREELRDCRWEVSDWQLALSGVYELTAARYEILCGRQGARGFADPTLLESIVDASADLSWIGQEAFQLQQTQEIRSAARVAGSRRRSNGPRGSSRPSGSTVGGGVSSASSRGARGGNRGGGGSRSGRGGRAGGGSA
jgi:hypothetical protein